MKNILIISTLLIASTVIAAPKYGPKAKPISSLSNLEYFQKNKAPDYWALSAFYVPQETPRGCSAANLTMILNAARIGMPLKLDDENIHFKNFLEKYVDKDYSDAITGKSITTGENFSNKNLTRLLNEASKKLNIPNANPHAEFAIIDQKDLKKSKKQFIEALKLNEKSSNDFIFFSFLQNMITDDPEGGAHVATVGAYDAKKNQVLVMDPDRQWYEPYWTSVDDLFEAISKPASDSRKEAGWIYFEIRPKGKVLQ